MNGDAGVQLLWAVIAIALVASSLFGRQLGLGQVLRLVLAWLAIFALVYVGFLFRDEARAVWSRAAADAGGTGVPTTAGASTAIAMSDDGHFHVRAKVNGVTVAFLIDSGATTTALNAATARAAGVEPNNSIQRPVNTANGTVLVSTARIALLEVGNIRQTDARAIIGESFGNTNVLGMTFLSQLKSWRVEGRTLTLEP